MNNENLDRLKKARDMAFVRNDGAAVIIFERVGKRPDVVSIDTRKVRE